MGPELAEDMWHTDLVRIHLTKRLDDAFPLVRDEVATAFDEWIGNPDGDEYLYQPVPDHASLTFCSDWIALPAMDLIRHVVCRASNRIFVGVPKCRDQDWCKINIEYATDVVKGQYVLNFFPPFLKP